MKKTVVLAFALAACMVLPVSAKKKSVQIKGIEDLDGKRIGVQGGTTGETYVQENLKNAKLSSFKSGMDAALDLMNGQIDAIVLDELPAKQIVSRNSKKLKIVDSKFAQEEYSIAVKAYTEDGILEGDEKIRKGGDILKTGDGAAHRLHAEHERGKAEQDHAGVLFLVILAEHVVDDADERKDGSEG